MQKSGRIVGESKPQVHILVAEDDGFQRLALVDILGLCNYEVTAVENGRLAKEELLKEDSQYDLVLLDLMMPEMDGLELLVFMKDNEKLRDIPVIMMSSDGELENVATCMSKGAKDYLIKPIRITNVRGLSNHVDFGQKKQKGGGASLTQYERIRTLGRGAAGAVDLVRSSADGKLYAMKAIDLKLMSPHERKLAENEVTLLKVLNGPTIIRYYESFSENDTIHIVMEYAEGGCLTDRINEHRKQGIPIPEEKILQWMAQLVIGVALMHSKNILHRDIKTQNLFLVKNDVVKLGDFGIAKALGTKVDLTRTVIGTPYFMSPEVCRQETYGPKADIWALGCALYELVMLKRPFQHESLNGVFDSIVNKDYDPLPENAHPDIKNLVSCMLQKDPKKRPSIWDLAENPCIKERINKFVEENNCRESVESIFDLEMKNKRKPELSMPTVPEEPKEVDLFTPQKLTELYQQLKSTIQLKTVKTGMFSKVDNVFTGEDLKKWYGTRLNTTNEDKIQQAGDYMMDQNWIISANGYVNFKQDTKALYKFPAEAVIPGVNTFKKWTNTPRNAVHASVDLINKLNEALREMRSEAGDEIIIEKAAISSAYNKFLEATCELQTVKFTGLERKEKIAFFLNLYQVMHAGKIIKDTLNQNQNGKQSSGGGMFSKVMGFIPLGNKVDDYQFNIGDLYFTVDELKHGILRGNKKAQNSSYFKCFSEKDPKNQIIPIPINDQRIILTFIDDGSLPLKFEAYNAKDLDEKLDKHAKEFLSRYVVFNSSDGEIILPQVFKTYKDDFGNNITETIAFVLKYYSFEQNHEEILKLVKNREITVSYSD